MRPVAIVVLAWLASEPASELNHRVSHRRTGMRLHGVHHAAAPRSRFDSNDLIPLVWAAVAMCAMAYGTAHGEWRWLVWAGTGNALYGTSYFFVHDLYIHRRFGWLGTFRTPFLDRLADAHRVHHLYAGEPY